MASPPTDGRVLPRRTALLLAGVFLTLAAHGQQILTDPAGESCQLTPACEKHKYAFVPDPGQTFIRWQVRGDLTLLSPPEQNPGVACSAGYGKGRLTAQYYTLRTKGRCLSKECPDTVYHTLDYDLFKQFPAPDAISGPACARPGATVSYSVPPRLTDWPHRATGIGTDGYIWSGFPAGTALTFAGDSSSVLAALPAPLPPTGFRVRVQVGHCNSAAPAELAVQPAQVLATAIGPPACGMLGGAAFATVFIATRVGLTYGVGLPAGWRFANGSTGTLSGNDAVQGVYFTSDGSGGNLVFTATGGCDGPQTVAWSFLP